MSPSYPNRPQGSRIPAGTSKPLREPSGFYCMPSRVADREFYGSPGGNSDDLNLSKPNSQSLDAFNHKKDS